MTLPLKDHFLGVREDSGELVEAGTEVCWALAAVDHNGCSTAAGHYAAFVIDPDANNVEAIFPGDRKLSAA